MTDTAAPRERFDTRAGYQAGIDQLFDLASHTLQISENDASEMGLGSAANQQRLWRFFTQPSPGRLQLLLAREDYLRTGCPRFTQLAERFAHLIEVRLIPAELRHQPKGWLIADHLHYLERHHYDWFRGEWGSQRQYATQLSQLFATLWAQSLPISASQRLDL